MLLSKLYVHSLFRSHWWREYHFSVYEFHLFTMIVQKNYNYKIWYACILLCSSCRMQPRQFGGLLCNLTDLFNWMQSKPRTSLLLILIAYESMIYWLLLEFFFLSKLYHNSNSWKSSSPTWCTYIVWLALRFNLLYGQMTFSLLQLTDKVQEIFGNSKIESNQTGVWPKNSNIYAQGISQHKVCWNSWSSFSS